MAAPLLLQLRQELLAESKPKLTFVDQEVREARTATALHLLSCSDNPTVSHESEVIHVREYAYRNWIKLEYKSLLKEIGLVIPLNTTEAMIISWYILTYGPSKISKSTLSLITSIDQLYSLTKQLLKLENKTVPALIVALLYGANIQETGRVKIPAADAWKLAYAVIGPEMQTQVQSPYYCVENIKTALREKLLPIVRLTTDGLKQYLFSAGWINPWELGCETTPDCTYLRLLRYAGGRVVVDAENDTHLVSDLSETEREELFQELRRVVDESQIDPDLFGFRVIAELKVLLLEREESEKFSSSEEEEN